MDDLCTGSDQPPENCRQNAQYGIRANQDDIWSGLAHRLSAPCGDHPDGVYHPSEIGGLAETRAPDAADRNTLPLFAPRVLHRLISAIPGRREGRHCPSAPYKSGAEISEMRSTYNITGGKVMVKNSDTWFLRSLSARWILLVCFCQMQDICVSHSDANNPYTSWLHALLRVPIRLIKSEA